MEYLKNKRNGVIYAVKGVGSYYGDKHYSLQQKGSKRIIQIKEKTVNQTLVWYKPGFFESIKLFFEFYK